MNQTTDSSKFAPVYSRSHGRVDTAAYDAIGRVQETRRKIAESISDSDEEARPDVQKSSSSEPTRQRSTF